MIIEETRLEKTAIILGLDPVLKAFSLGPVLWGAVVYPTVFSLGPNRVLLRVQTRLRDNLALRIFDV